MKGSDLARLQNADEPERIGARAIPAGQLVLIVAVPCRTGGSAVFGHQRAIADGVESERRLAAVRIVAKSRNSPNDHIVSPVSRDLTTVA